jgi:osmotically-inducible protein OsmY
MMRLLAPLFGLVLLSTQLGGCVPLVVGGAAAAGGTAIAQERTPGNALDDTSLKILVNDAIVQNEPNLLPSIQTEVIEGRVLLAGSVPTPEDRIKVARLVWPLEGVREVINELEVGNRVGVTDYLNDTRIAAQVRIKLAAATDVKSINYTIETINGRVYVIGIAQDQAEMDRALDIVSRVGGVREVVNYAILKDDARRAGVRT